VNSTEVLKHCHYCVTPDSALAAAVGKKIGKSGKKPRPSKVTGGNWGRKHIPQEELDGQVEGAWTEGEKCRKEPAPAARLFKL